MLVPDTVRVSTQAAVGQCQSDPTMISERRSIRIFTAVEFCEWCVGGDEVRFDERMCVVA